MKTAELIGPALDWAVAKCEGETAHVQFSALASSKHYFAPSKNWNQGGPIIEREKIFIVAPYRSATSWKAYKMEWDQPELPSYMEDGPTPLIAAMRCYVASKLGDEIEIPGGCEMTTEQQRKMLEAAAKACRYEYPHMLFGGRVWNPLTNPADTAEMCAKLNIDWLNKRDWVLCRTTTSHGYVVKTDAQKIENHDNSRLKAWMFAATMCAAKTQGYEE